ncbi:MAG: hypothetical protein WC143_04675 [Eubacteriales bacterium]
MSKSDYDRIDNNEKVIRKQNTLFDFPTDPKGKTDCGVRKFLIFYFDDEADYEVVLSKLVRVNPHVKAHPDMDSVKLAELARKMED